jgi:hypothetical protein
VVDVVDLATAVAQLDQDAMTSTMSSLDSVPGALDLLAADAAVELHAADRPTGRSALRNRTGRGTAFSTASSVGGSPGRIMR